MKRAGYYLYVVLAFTLLACKQADHKAVKQKHQSAAKVPAVITEDKAVKLILNLEEVKRKDAIVRKESKGKRHLSTYVETLPTNADPNYWVKVAEDNGGSYVTYYTFAVHSKTHDISYYDIMQNTMISLNQWRSTTPVNER